MVMYSEELEKLAKFVSVIGDSLLEDDRWLEKAKAILLLLGEDPTAVEQEHQDEQEQFQRDVIIRPQSRAMENPPKRRKTKHT